jgi:hypothetical protein
MPTHEFAPYADPFDLLRRFLPTPFKAMYRSGLLRTTVHTNDSSLFPSMPFGWPPDVQGRCDWEWKLLRDAASTGALEPALCFSTPELTIVTMGNAFLLGVDHERQEVLGFIGADVDAQTHQDVLVPLICRIAYRGSLPERFPVYGNAEEEFAND